MYDNITNGAAWPGHLVEAAKLMREKGYSPLETDDETLAWLACMFGEFAQARPLISTLQFDTWVGYGPVRRITVPFDNGVTGLLDWARALRARPHCPERRVEERRQGPGRRQQDQVAIRVNGETVLVDPDLPLLEERLRPGTTPDCIAATWLEATMRRAAVATNPAVPE